MNSEDKTISLGDDDDALREAVVEVLKRWVPS